MLVPRGASPPHGPWLWAKRMPKGSTLLCNPGQRVVGTLSDVVGDLAHQNWTPLVRDSHAFWGNPFNAGDEGLLGQLARINSDGTFTRDDLAAAIFGWLKGHNPTAAANLENWGNDSRVKNSLLNHLGRHNVFSMHLGLVERVSRGVYRRTDKTWGDVDREAEAEHPRSEWDAREELERVILLLEQEGSRLLKQAQLLREKLR